ncbi:uncharacterized protein LOC143666919 isoform X2 [Tamandua tetradactyla]|uniref:uncharacterized protein LOC143666919 isoform X2 n=1 Tax=Tamandua tetradactyla TaxID=48850 RepID=UPI0040537E5D
MASGLGGPVDHLLTAVTQADTAHMQSPPPGRGVAAGNARGPRLTGNRGGQSLQLQGLQGCPGMVACGCEPSREFQVAANREQMPPGDSSGGAGSLTLAKGKEDDAHRVAENSKGVSTWKQAIFGSRLLIHQNLATATAATCVLT